MAKGRRAVAVYAMSFELFRETACSRGRLVLDYNDFVISGRASGKFDVKDVQGRQAV